MENPSKKKKAKDGKMKNPHLSAASTAASATYVAPVPAPSEPRHSGRNIQTIQKSASRVRELTLTEEEQTKKDEEVARRLEENNNLYINAGNQDQVTSLDFSNKVELDVAQALMGLRNGWVIVREGDLRMISSISESISFGDPLKVLVAHLASLACVFDANVIQQTQGDQQTSQTFPKKGKNAPKKAIGDRPLAAGIDRTNAVTGVADRSKLKIKFNTERDDPDREGGVIPGDPVEYDYLENHAEPDWNNAEEVRILNTWRRQIFGRNFAPIRKTRELWLQSEKDLVLTLMREQLEQRGFIKWNRLSNRFNLQMHLAGVVQPFGQGFIKSGNQNISILREDRVAPFRSKQAIMGQSIKWKEYDALLDSFQSATSNVDETGQDTDKHSRAWSDDEEEIPDPEPGPRSDIIGWRAKAKARTAAAKTSITLTTAASTTSKITSQLKTTTSEISTTSNMTSLSTTTGTNTLTHNGGKRTKRQANYEEKLELSSDGSEDAPAEVPTAKRAKKGVRSMAKS
jgi:hypothetical protein